MRRALALAALLALPALTGCTPWQRWQVTSGPTLTLDLSHAARYDGQTGGAMGGYVPDVVILDPRALARVAAMFGEHDAQWAEDHEYGHRVALRLGLGYPLATDPPKLAGLYGQERAAQCVAEAVDGPPPAWLVDPAHGYWRCPAAIVKVVAAKMRAAGML